MLQNPVLIKDFEEIMQDCNLNFEQLKGKRILITGASGLIASYLIEFLCYLNDYHFTSYPIKIYALARNINKLRKKFAYHLAKDYFNLIVQDVTQEVYECYPDFIFHAASNASSKHFNEDPLGIMNANITGTKNMIQLMTKNPRSKMLFISSGEVYGTDAPVPTKENESGYVDLSNPRSCYAESKRAGEVYSLCGARQFKLDIRIARPFHSYGAGIDLNNDDRVFASFTKSCVEKTDIVMNSDGSAVRSFLYLKDLITGFFYILFKGKPMEAYNVAASTGTYIWYLAETLGRLFNLEVKYNNNTPSDASQSKIICSIANVTKLQALGWKQTINIEEGFTRTVNSYQTKKEN